MKKLFPSVALQIVSLILALGIAEPAVFGPCADCHTMHNSQSGSPMAVDEKGEVQTAPIAHLTRSNCIGCHNGALTATGFAGVVPDIFAADGLTLAGGSFNENYSDTGFRKHNVTDVTWLLSDEPILTTVTPGRDAAESHNDIPRGSNELTCAGSAGCHGNHDVAGSDAGIMGFHHGSSAYRYLTYYDGAAHTDIKGKGSTDWEIETLRGVIDHNVYYAADVDTAPIQKDSISALCAMCHGDFHDNTDTSSDGVWRRHPTEIAVAILGNVQDITIDIVNNPFGFDSTDFPTVNISNMTNYDADTGKVVCVSCHRAHGTQHNDLLRWNYDTQVAGSGVDFGCLGCHVQQR